MTTSTFASKGNEGNKPAWFDLSLQPSLLAHQAGNDDEKGYFVYHLECSCPVACHFYRPPPYRTGQRVPNPL